MDLFIYPEVVGSFDLRQPIDRISILVLSLGYDLLFTFTYYCYYIFVEATYTVIVYEVHYPLFIPKLKQHIFYSAIFSSLISLSFMHY